jgi:hypothetical protein
MVFLGGGSSGGFGKSTVKEMVSELESLVSEIIGKVNLVKSLKNIGNKDLERFEAGVVLDMAMLPLVSGISFVAK